VLARVRTHIALRQARDALAGQNQKLEEAVIERTRELALTQEVTIRALASLAETRDNETGNHLKRTQHYIKRLAEEIRDHPRYKDELTDRAIELMVKSAPLHDIGKVGIRDSILLKPGKLNEEEFEVMKTHPVVGTQALRAAMEDHSRPTEFLRYAIDIVGGHHEKWDGSGYPLGLKGDQIPLAARLMALADVYDALVSRRSYKAPFAFADAVSLIKKGSGQHFDPDLVIGFERCVDTFETIAKTYADESEHGFLGGKAGNEKLHGSF
jgi:putative two-component system response regulator